ncbi:MAG: hypothetical protein V4438_02335 [Patescibacteria group bacterium]
MKKTIFLIVILAAIALVSWYVFRDSNIQVKTDDQASQRLGTEDLGIYPYVCDNSMEFTMSPSSDMSSVHIVPGKGAKFPEATLAKAPAAAGQKYEAVGIIFIGAGEGVTLTTGGKTYACDPMPQPERAPWNFGDAGEGGGSAPYPDLQ